MVYTLYGVYCRSLYDDLCSSLKLLSYVCVATLCPGLYSFFGRAKIGRQMSTQRVMKVPTPEDCTSGL